MNGLALSGLKRGRQHFQFSCTLSTFTRYRIRIMVERYKSFLELIDDITQNPIVSDKLNLLFLPPTDLATTQIRTFAAAPRVLF